MWWKAKPTYYDQEGSGKMVWCVFKSPEKMKKILRWKMNVLCNKGGEDEVFLLLCSPCWRAYVITLYIPSYQHKTISNKHYKQLKIMVLNCCN